MPRTGPVPRPGTSGGVYVPGYRTYNNYYYYYPRHLYPYGYGAFGLGYFYYDPYYWGPAYDSPAYGYDYPLPPADAFDTGEIRLEVRPRDAEVYVNGYYAGHVDDFDGYFQGLKLTAGNYHLSIVAPGYEPLEFDVQVSAGKKISYQGELLRQVP